MTEENHPAQGLGRRPPRYPVLLPVDEADAGRQIERFLGASLPAGRDHVAKLLRQGRVRFVPTGAAAQVVDAGFRLGGPGSVEILARTRTEMPPPVPNRRVRLRVLFEDADLLVLFKPPGLAMHPGPGHGTDTLQNVLVGRFPDIVELGPGREYGLVHRLDQETSGLLVAARSVEAYDGLVRRFRERQVEKEYLALVRSRDVGPDQGCVDHAVDGKPAETRFQIIERVGPASLVSLRPTTGRTHQIRIHLAAIDMPVLGDVRYGNGRDELTARLYLTRLALHAHRLAFEHPVTGARHEFEEPLPRDLRHALKRCRRLR